MSDVILTERFQIIRNQAMADIVPVLPDDYYNVYRKDDVDLDSNVAKMNIYHSTQLTDIKLRNRGVQLSSDEWDELRSTARLLLQKGKQ